jgi:hypothetical protein
MTREEIAKNLRSREQLRVQITTMAKKCWAETVQSSFARADPPNHFAAISQGARTAVMGFVRRLPSQVLQGVPNADSAGSTLLRCAMPVRDADLRPAGGRACAESRCAARRGFCTEHHHVADVRADPNARGVATTTQFH